MKRARLLFLPLLIIFLFACVHTPGVKMTHKDMVGWAWSIYNGQYEEYKRMVGLGGVPSSSLDDLTETQKAKMKAAIAALSPEQKVMLQGKKALFKELHPLLLTASKYVDTGKIPPGEIETQINQLIDKLIAMQSP